jgi:hypothetical protein
VVKYPWFFSRLPRAPGKLFDERTVLNYDYHLSFREAYFCYLLFGLQYLSPGKWSDTRYFDFSKARTMRTDFAAAEAVVYLELVK